MHRHPVNPVGKFANRCVLGYWKTITSIAISRVGVFKNLFNFCAGCSNPAAPACDAANRDEAANIAPAAIRERDFGNRISIFINDLSSLNMIFS